MTKAKHLLAVFICMLGALGLRATHIVGAELYYTCIDSSSHLYEITLKLYRDCDRGQANFDNPIELYIFNGSTGRQHAIINMPRPANTPRIAPENWDDCVGSTYTICVEEGIYRDTIALPPNLGGYDLGWARCCRNSAITNLDQPLGQGVTFLAHVPGSQLASCNSMPVFRQVPPVFLCANQTFNFDHSAVDADGDSLVYRITNPYLGLDMNGAGAGNSTVNPGDPDPIVGTIANNPMGPPPYQNTPFASGYTWSSPFGAGPISLDPQTGFLSLVPPTPGIFVVAISVFEYRNGQLLSEQKRDFQIHVVPCIDQGDPPVITHDLSGLNHRGDTVCVASDEDFCYTFTVTDTDPGDTLHAFAVSPEFNSGATFGWAGINPVTGFVCWEPGCEYVNSITPLIIAARDTGDCPSVKTVYDTVWIKVLPPQNKPPAITTNLSGFQMSGDTIVVTAEDDLCVPFVVTDSNDTDSLTLTALGTIFSGQNPPQLTVNGVNPLWGTVCWKPACSYKDQIIEIVLEARDHPECADSAIVLDTIYIKVIVPPNNPPVISIDLGGLPRRGDTLEIIALDSFCFDFTVSDPDISDTLVVIPVSSVFQQNDGPTISWSGANPLQGQVCWTPSCAWAGQLVMLEIGGRDDGICNTAREVFDTVWVEITVPPNQAPVGWHDLSLVDSTSGDTIIVQPTNSFCYPVSFSDPDMGDSLLLETVGLVFDTAANAPRVDVRGTNPLSIDVCWTPGCEYQGKTIPLILKATDNGDCNNVHVVYDTVWVKILKSRVLPPQISVDFGSLNTRGDTIDIWVDDSVCYDVVVLDQTPENGIRTEYTFESAGGGRNLGYGDWSFRQQDNRLIGRICLKAPCLLGGSLFRMRLKAWDLPKCPPTDSAEKIVYLRVRTTFESFAGRDTFFCHGEGGVRLAAIPIGGVPPYDFLWTCDAAPFCGLSSPYDSIPTANPARSTTFRVQITDSRGCKSEVDDVDVFIQPKPVVDAGPDQWMCEGGQGVILQGSVINQNQSPGPFSHQWSPAAGLVDSTKLRPLARPEKTTIYTLIVKDLSTGCSSFTTTLDPKSTAVVNVKPRPTVDAGPDRIVCPRDSVPLIGKAWDAPPPYNYVWTPANGINLPNSPTPNVSPPFTYTYFLVAFSQGCPSVADSVTVEVRTMPTADAGNHFEICEGDSLRMRGLAGGDSTATYTYNWTPGRWLSDSTAQHPVAFPEKDILYSVVATSSHGCVSLPYDVNLRLAPRPVAEVTASRDWICAGDTVDLYANHGWVSNEPPGANVYYTWSPHDQMDDRHLQHQRQTPSGSVTYVLQATHLACSSFDSVELVVYDPPLLNLASSEPAICGRDSIQLLASGGNGAATFSWEPAPGLTRHLTFPLRG
jgi:hypothetical protein